MDVIWYTAVCPYVFKSVVIMSDNNSKSNKPISMKLSLIIYVLIDRQISDLTFPSYWVLFIKWGNFPNKVSTVYKSSMTLICG